jgi:hypothetical protein
MSSDMPIPKLPKLPQFQGLESLLDTVFPNRQVAASQVTVAASTCINKTKTYEDYQHQLQGLIDRSSYATTVDSINSYLAQLDHMRQPIEDAGGITGMKRKQLLIMLNGQYNLFLDRRNQLAGDTSAMTIARKKISERQSRAAKNRSASPYVKSPQAETANSILESIRKATTQQELDDLGIEVYQARDSGAITDLQEITLNSQRGQRASSLRDRSFTFTT